MREDHLRLIHPLQNDEVINSINSFQPLKAPGSDGLHPRFYQKYWDTIGSSVKYFFYKAFQDHQIDPSINTIYICLIPKKDNASTISQYRPISLCNTIYKIITKIIMNRLKPILEQIIHPSQSSFQKNKRAADNAIIVQEIIRNFAKTKGNNFKMLLKLDLEKAFDKLEWSFIHHTLISLNFPSDIIKLIMSCITTASTSILINGNPIDYFQPMRGIKQGDPLSPYLFILCLEMLSRKINIAVDYRSWTPISLAKRGPQISHLLFTDDIILTSQITVTTSHSILNTLSQFTQ